ncbi:MAG: Gfo/Idh/MocA family oxidoreductase [Phycisphaerales bacterium]|nr:Gfo/Idh/MocA family oxidoreductase [Phycisphaerales bacterium]MCI0630490.1 Gfo/Idh/MocA family oxidoreductase [Phycisphaerales bacterium]MCI0674948.1 Gfo/Idh/MocA family oxidoreductase [Phycisphaerales bacterium]
MADRKLRCGVVGVGRMGRHHARVYAQSPDVELVGVVDVNPEASRNIAEQWGGRAFADVIDLLNSGVDAVSIATPTVHHRAVAERLLEAKVACLIEKPLAADVDEARAIAQAADRSGAVLQVGHIVRYDPVMVAISKLQGLKPRFIEMDRISPMTFRSVDVGVVLDMMIHDLDLLLMLVGREPDEVHASAVCVLGEAEDVCNARLTFASGEHGEGCVANLTASRLALKTERKIRIISEDAYVSADFVARSGTVVRKTANADQLAQLRSRLKAGDDLSDVDYRSLVQSEPLKIGDGEPLKLQIEDFLSAVRSGRRPTVDAQAGFAAVRTAERIVDAARQAGAKMV